MSGHVVDCKETTIPIMLNTSKMPSEAVHFRPWIKIVIQLDYCFKCLCYHQNKMSIKMSLWKCKDKINCFDFQVENFHDNEKNECINPVDHRGICFSIIYPPLLHVSVNTLSLFMLVNATVREMLLFVRPNSKNRFNIYKLR